VLFSQVDVHIEGDAEGPPHTHFSFSGVSAGELRIKYDTTTDGHGNGLDSDDVGLDNINFSQSAAGPLIGDFNQNGSVDAADYVRWRENNATNTVLPNDNGLGTPISQSHYDLWRTHFGRTAGGGASIEASSAVPEPATWLTLASGALAATLLRRRANFSIRNFC
jgi:hypothetical protein